MGQVLVSKKDYFFNFVKGVFASLCLSLILILIFAFLLKYVSLSDNTIKIINQFIKIISILYGLIVLSKKDKSALFFKGILLGIFYGALSYLIFSLLNGSFSVELTTLNDLVFNAIVGAIIGLFLNLIRNKKTA